MNILVCNIGSTSLKFQLLAMPVEEELARGHVERIGSAQSRSSYWIGNRQAAHSETPIPNHSAAVQSALDFLQVGDRFEINAVGFKCIQAGDRNGSVPLEQPVLDAMESYADLAPAHNPPYLEAIYRFRDLAPELPLVGVFEPAFHANVPEHAKVYGTPWEWYADLGVKKYGYHGASHQYAAGEVVRILQLPQDRHKIINCHLGGSSSICAIQNGVSVDTSMGFTPQTGLLQGTRIGDLDPFVLPYVMRRKGITLEEALVECCEKSGLAGLSGTSGDMRDIKRKIAQGSRKAQVARDKFIYDIKRYIGEYLLVMEGLDAVSFTGGIGQNDPELRQEVLSSLGFLGLELDAERNSAGGPAITTQNSKISALVIQANEEIVVARETFRVLVG